LSLRVVIVTLIFLLLLLLIHWCCCYIVTLLLFPFVCCCFVVVIVVIDYVVDCYCYCQIVDCCCCYYCWLLPVTVVVVVAVVRCVGGCCWMDYVVVVCWCWFAPCIDCIIVVVALLRLRYVVVRCVVVVAVVYVVVVDLIVIVIVVVLVVVVVFCYSHLFYVDYVLIVFFDWWLPYCYYALMDDCCGYCFLVDLLLLFVGVIVVIVDSIPHCCYAVDEPLLRYYYGIDRVVDYQLLFGLLVWCYLLALFVIVDYCVGIVVIINYWRLVVDIVTVVLTGQYDTIDCWGLLIRWWWTGIDITVTWRLFRCFGYILLWWLLLICSLRYGIPWFHYVDLFTVITVLLLFITILLRFVELLLVLLLFVVERLRYSILLVIVVSYGLLHWFGLHGWLLLLICWLFVAPRLPFTVGLRLLIYVRCRVTQVRCRSHLGHHLHTTLRLRLRCSLFTLRIGLRTFTVVDARLRLPVDAMILQLILRSRFRSVWVRSLGSVVDFLVVVLVVHCRLLLRSRSTFPVGIFIWFTTLLRYPFTDSRCIYCRFVERCYCVVDCCRLFPVFLLLLMSCYRWLRGLLLIDFIVVDCCTFPVVLLVGWLQFVTFVRPVIVVVVVTIILPNRLFWLVMIAGCCWFWWFPVTDWLVIVDYSRWRYTVTLRDGLIYYVTLLLLPSIWRTVVVLIWWLMMMMMVVTVDYRFDLVDWVVVDDSVVGLLLLLLFTFPLGSYDFTLFPVCCCYCCWIYLPICSFTVVTLLEVVVAGCYCSHCCCGVVVVGCCVLVAITILLLLLLVLLWFVTLRLRCCCSLVGYTIPFVVVALCCVVAVVIPTALLPFGWLRLFAFDCYGFPGCCCWFPGMITVWLFHLDGGWFCWWLPFSVVSVTRSFALITFVTVVLPIVGFVVVLLFVCCCCCCVVVVFRYLLRSVGVVDCCCYSLLVCAIC